MHANEMERRTYSSLFTKGDKEDPGNYRGITPLSVVEKVFYKIVWSSI